MYDVNGPDNFKQIEKLMAGGPLPSETLRLQVMNAVELKLGGSASVPVWQIVGASIAFMLLSWGVWVNIHNPQRPEPDRIDPDQHYQDIRKAQPALTRDEVWQEMTKDDPALRLGTNPPNQAGNQATSAPATHP